jgi:hypothetical protein
MASPAASVGPVSVPLPPSTGTQDPPPQSAVQAQPKPGAQLHTLAVQPYDGSHTNPGPHTSGLSFRAQPGGGGPHALASLAASTVPALWPLPPVTVPEAFDPPDAPVEDEPAPLSLGAPAVPEPLSLIEDLPPQRTPKATSTTSSAAPLVSVMATPGPHYTAWPVARRPDDLDVIGSRKGQNRTALPGVCSRSSSPATGARTRPKRAASPRPSSMCSIPRPPFRLQDSS